MKNWVIFLILFSIVMLVYDTETQQFRMFWFDGRVTEFFDDGSQKDITLSEPTWFEVSPRGYIKEHEGDVCKDKSKPAGD
jgi:hypothetical protein